MTKNQALEQINSVLFLRGQLPLVSSVVRKVKVSDFRYLANVARYMLKHLNAALFQVVSAYSRKS